MYGSPLERRQALVDEAVTLAQRSGDDATIVRVLNAVMHAVGIPHLLEQSLRRSDEALERAERLGDPVLLFWTLQYTRLLRADGRRSRRAQPVSQPRPREASPSNLTSRSFAGRTPRSAPVTPRPPATTARLRDWRTVRSGSVRSAANRTPRSSGDTTRVAAFQRGEVASWIPILEEYVTENPGLPSLVATLAGRTSSRADRSGPFAQLRPWWRPNSISPWTSVGSSAWRRVAPSSRLGDVEECSTALRAADAVRPLAALGGRHQLVSDQPLPRWPRKSSRPFRPTPRLLRPVRRVQRASRRPSNYASRNRPRLGNDAPRTRRARQPEKARKLLLKTQASAAAHRLRIRRTPRDRSTRPRRLTFWDTQECAGDSPDV